MPILIIQPSGITSTSRHKRSGKVTPISCPYAPRSSEVSHNSTTPSENKENDLVKLSEIFNCREMLLYPTKSYQSQNNYFSRWSYKDIEKDLRALTACYIMY